MPDVITDAPTPDATDAGPDTASVCDPACASGETCTPFGTCVTTVVPTNCGEAHGIAGCCGPDNSVYWFENGALQGSPNNCGDTPCGWNTTEGFYTCGASAADADVDPSGTYPWECGPLTPVPADCPVADCTGKTCGPDGAGGSCGDCPSGEFCDPSGTCQLNGTLVCDTSSATCTSVTECECVGCNSDGACSAEDDCVCPDCSADSYCSDATNCNGDGVCDPYNEGCVCSDCAAHPSCL